MKTIKVGDWVKVYGICESVDHRTYYQANGVFKFRVVSVFKDGFVEVRGNRDSYYAHAKQLRRVRTKSGAV